MECKEFDFPTHPHYIIIEIDEGGRPYTDFKEYKSVLYDHPANSYNFRNGLFEYDSENNLSARK